MRQVIHGEIYSSDFNNLHQLIVDWASAYRFAFCRFQKDKLSFNEVRNQTKIKYQSLNTRQISDAVRQAQGLYLRVKDKKVIFGGRKNWDKLVKGEIANQQWKDKRDNQIYAQGDKTKNGNPNLRLINKGENFYLRVTSGNRKFEEYKLFIPVKFQERLFSLFGADVTYNVRLLKKDEQHYRVIIDYEVEDPKISIDFSNGVIGIDINPDKVAISNLTVDGNLIKSFTMVNNRMFFASTNKRNYEIGCIVKQIIAYAIEKSKGIVFENLQFKKEFEDQGRKFNRIKSNFVWKKTLTLLERKCIENGIRYKKVNSALTSIIGRLKYQKMYNLSIHESASYVIGRRGLGLNERLSLYNYPTNCVKELTFDLVGDKVKRIHSFRLWRKLRDNYKAVLTGLQGRMSNLKELDGNLCNIGENPIGKVIPQELVVGRINVN
jgi:IS605 OrfB family transposase